MRFDYLIGASVSEPHIDEFNVNFLYFYISTRGNRTPGSRDATGCNCWVVFVALNSKLGKLKRALEHWRLKGRQKHSQLHYQDEFQPQNCTVGSLHDSDHEDLVRTFVGPSCRLGGFLFVYICFISEGQPHSW